MDKQLKVFVIHSQSFMRTALRMMLDTQNGIHVVGDSGSAMGALREIRHSQPDIVLCDTHVEGISGIELTSRITRGKYGAKVLIVSSVCDGHMPARVMEAGAKGYLHSTCSMDELVNALHRVARGELYLCRSVAQSLALNRVHGERGMSSLSPRELEVGLLLTQGYRPQQIATSLSLSVKTISTHKARLFTKLSVTNVPKLVTVFREHGYDVLPV